MHLSRRRKLSAIKSTQSNNCIKLSRDVKRLKENSIGMEAILDTKLRFQTNKFTNKVSLIKNNNYIGNYINF